MLLLKSIEPIWEQPLSDSRDRLTLADILIDIKLKLLFTLRLDKLTLLEKSKETKEFVWAIKLDRELKSSIPLKLVKTNVYRWCVKCILDFFASNIVCTWLFGLQI